MGILRQPAVADFGPSKDSLDHQEHRFDFRADLRLRAIAGALRLTQGPMAMGFGLDEALGIGSVVPDHVALPAVGRIAPHAGLLSMQQLRQHLAVMHIRRRGRHRMDQFGPAVHPDMGLHAEVPLVALLRLMHLRIPLLRAILRRTGRTDNGGIHDGAPADLQALLRPDTPRSAQRAVRPPGGLPAGGETCRSSSHRARARGPDQCPRTAAGRASRTAPPPPPDPTG